MLGGDTAAAAEAETGPSDAAATGATGAVGTGADTPAPGVAGTGAPCAAGADTTGAADAAACDVGNATARGCAVRSSTREKNKRTRMAVKPSDAELDFMPAETGCKKKQNKRK